MNILPGEGILVRFKFHLFGIIKLECINGNLSFFAGTYTSLRDYSYTELKFFNQFKRQPRHISKIKLNVKKKKYLFIV